MASKGLVESVNAYDEIFFSKTGRSHLEANDSSLCAGSKRTLRPLLIPGSEHLGDPKNDDLVVNMKGVISVHTSGNTVSLDSKPNIRTLSTRDPTLNPSMTARHAAEMPLRPFFINSHFPAFLKEAGNEWYANYPASARGDLIHKHLLATLDSLNGLYIKNPRVAEVYHQFINGKLPFIRGSYLEDHDSLGAFAFKQAGCGVCQQSLTDISHNQHAQGATLTSHLFVFCPVVRNVLTLLGVPLPEDITYYISTISNHKPCYLPASPQPFLLYAIWRMERDLRITPRDMTSTANQLFYRDFLQTCVHKTFDVSIWENFICHNQVDESDQTDMGVT